MLLTRILDDYAYACKGKNLSRATLRWYESNLRYFTSWLGTQGITQLEDIRPAVVHRFADHLATTPGYDTHRGQGTDVRTAQTVKGYVQVVKGFLAWAAKEDLVDAKVAARIDLPRVDEKVIRTLTPGMYKALWEAAASEYQVWLTYRDRAILALLLDTGIRADELCRLSADHVELRGGYLLVEGKGRKEREVGPLGEGSTAAVKRYLSRYRPHVDLPAAFLSRFHKPLSVSGLDQVLYRLEKWAGPETFWEVRVSAHTFRHTYACAFLEHGGDVYKLSRLMGHTSVQVTERYLRAFNAKAARNGKSVLDDLVG